LVSTDKTDEIYGLINSLEVSFLLSFSSVGCVSFEVMVILRPKPQFVRRPLYDVQYKTKQASGGSGGMARGPRASLNLEKKLQKEEKPPGQAKQPSPSPQLEV